MIVFKTLTLKVHKPSRAKQLIMEEAMDRYARALQRLLDAAWEQIEELEALYLKRGRMAVGNYFLTPELLRTLNTFNVQPFKDSLKIEFLNLLESYLKRRQKSVCTRYPSVYYDTDRLIESLEKECFAQEDITSKKYFEKLFEKYNSGKSVYFCRYSDFRDFCLLYEPYKRKFFAKLYLLNQKDALKRVPRKNGDTFLTVVGKNALLPETHKSERYIIVPLSFGKPQQDILMKALETPGMLKTARLIKKEGSFYLSVSVATEAAPLEETKGYVGFCMTEEGLMRYTVCSLTGNRLEEGTLELCRASEALEQMHRLANEMAHICKRFQAQAILESYPQNNRLAQLLDYKLQLMGLNKSVRVSPFGLWQTCPRCGYNGRSNNLMSNLFMCTECGFALEKHLLPSYNLAKRLIKYQNDKVRFTLEEGPHHTKKIKSDLLGIEYTLPHKQSVENFFDYIHQRTREVESLLSQSPTTWSKEQKKLYSLWKKLLSAQDVREVIEIEAIE